jgi:uncharacterized membrane protein
MQQRFSPLLLILFLLLPVMLLAFVQVGLLTIAFDKLGLSPSAAMFLLLGSLLGSMMNVPLFSIKADWPMQALPPLGLHLLRQSHLIFEGRTVIAVNVGGCIIPLGFSLFLLLTTGVSFLLTLLGIAFVATVSFMVSRPIQGMGIGMPILVAPLGAALVALLLDPTYSAPLAYISGSMGVLIGADLMRLKDIRRLGTPMASIGGAGTFDGIFITGIVAVLLA